VYRFVSCVDKKGVVKSKKTEDYKHANHLVFDQTRMKENIFNYKKEKRTDLVGTKT